MRDRNHPSVIPWRIGNEVGGSTTANDQSLKSWVLAMDPTRAVTWASNKMGGPHVSEGDDRNVAAPAASETRPRENARARAAAG